MQRGMGRDLGLDGLEGRREYRNRIEYGGQQHLAFPIERSRWAQLAFLRACQRPAG